MTPRSISQPGTPRGKKSAEEAMGRSPSAPGTPRSLHGSKARSDDDESDQEIVGVGNDTRPGTPMAGKGMTLGMRLKKEKTKDPVCRLSSVLMYSCAHYRHI
jgi:hypothetical protein